MKYHFLFIILFLVPLSLNIKAQPYNTQCEALVSGGGESSANSYTNLGLFGESIVNHSVSDNQYLTAIGFIFENGLYSDFVTMLSDRINIYPNPASNILYVIGVPSSSRMCIYNEIGLKIFEYNDQTEIPVNGLSSGIYFLTIINNKRNILFRDKFFVKH